MTHQLYRTSPVFSQDTIPQALLHKHLIKAESWGVLRVLEGQIWLVYEDSTERTLLTPATPGIIEPQVPHHVELDGNVSFRIEFFYERPEIGES